MSCSLGAEVGVAVASRTSSAENLEPLSLVVVCAWCGRPIGRGAVSSHRIVSHGICRPCSDNVLFSETSELLLRR
jgi:hypothetical protein